MQHHIKELYLLTTDFFSLLCIIIIIPAFTVVRYHSRSLALCASVLFQRNAFDGI